MIRKAIRLVFSLIGFIIGFTSYSTLAKSFEMLTFGRELYGLIAAIIFGIVLAILGYLIEPWASKKSKDVAKVLDKELSKYPQVDILLGSIGIIGGFVVAYLVSGIFNQIPLVGGFVSLLLYLCLGYVGMKIVLKSKNDLFNLSKLTRTSGSSKEKDKESKKDKVKPIPPKVLDTSVIIDGRIADICKTGFVEGTLIIPAFVLEELRHIADSSDDLKRVRGRRGLDILNIIQQELNIDVEISERDFDDIAEVDSKLLKLAQVLNGKVVTNDYNLNKVAQFQGVDVLNINELANAIKPVVIPGEDMVVQVVKDGKEAQQGIAYLDDGTMIVVDGGRRHMNETIKVLVTSVLQTPAGRMIFAKPKN
ncbi:PIN/TRAM domain-containing protein [Clostridioides mangenotii]|uniref:PIN/TRAM domain-containing protein n=1 Tax=Metaclostridioides mangenotii TaxID=1540 RepID=UPI001C101934|nr:PIN/TRAM domain-containing protein [Clostridioides mangenotii]MBU5308653.1 PIN/TRAM domain-containing protein [Clostridioides mangenotii]MCR1954401.1 PIN/TRAM domain-containing protein [Clostridioides mangenotii]